jgi:ABC-type antimicrobial peptide transport system permease subunit
VSPDVNRDRRRPARAATERVLTPVNLVTGVLALGLIVGVAGLGVISTRAVVERWQQIGMLRTLGYE